MWVIILVLESGYELYNMCKWLCFNVLNIFFVGYICVNKISNFFMNFDLIYFI